LGATHNFGSNSSIDGDLDVTFQANAVAHVTVGPTSSRNLILTEGAVALDGILNVSAQQGVVYSPGDNIRIVTAGSVIGQFDNVNAPEFNDLQITPVYGTDYLDLQISPKPASGPLHTLRNGVGDGKLGVTIDGYGSFGSAVGNGTTDAKYNPIGAVDESGTIYKSGLYLEGVADGWLSMGSFGESAPLAPALFTGGTYTAISEFNRGPLSFVVQHRLVDSYDENGVIIGTILEQTYEISNTSGAPLDFMLTRYVDGDLKFDGSISDGGGRVLENDETVLYETDSNSDADDFTTLVGITAQSYDATNRFEIDGFSELLSRIEDAELLDNLIDGDTDFDEFVDNPYDLALGISSSFQLAAFGNTFYTTKTLFGTSAPDTSGFREDDADFNGDGIVDGFDIMIWQQNLGIEGDAEFIEGDANGDGNINSYDLDVWKRQFGTGPLAGSGNTTTNGVIPEPTTLAILAIGSMGLIGAIRSRRAPRRVAVPLLFSAFLLAANTNAALAQLNTAKLSLNVHYNDFSQQTGGGSWFLVAKTTAGPGVNGGIASATVELQGINLASIEYGTGGVSALGYPAVTAAHLSALMNGDDVFAFSQGAVTHVVYTQDTANGPTTPSIGRGAGTPGNVAVDPLGDSDWNDAAVFMSGTFDTTAPSFVSGPGAPVAAINLFQSTQLNMPTLAAIETGEVRVYTPDASDPGDFNGDGAVDAADYVVWRKGLGTIYTQQDFNTWRAHFGQTTGSGSGANANATVPEPASMVLLVFAAAGWCLRRRRASQQLINI
jgi:hypothetical protein